MTYLIDILLKMGIILSKLIALCCPHNNITSENKKRVRILLFANMSMFYYLIFNWLGAQKCGLTCFRIPETYFFGCHSPKRVHVSFEGKNNIFKMNSHAKVLTHGPSFLNPPQIKHSMICSLYMFLQDLRIISFWVLSKHDWKIVMLSAWFGAFFSMIWKIYSKES